MSTYQVTLALNTAGSAGEIPRYCANCGRVVLFSDSGKIRRNANGKNIHVFAIYKCPQDHTWNRRMADDPLAADCAPERAESAYAETATEALGPAQTMVHLGSIRTHGYRQLTIQLISAPQKPGYGDCICSQRLDRLLAQHIPDTSRSEIQRWIQQGRLRVDGKTVKPSHALNLPATITVEL